MRELSRMEGRAMRACGTSSSRAPSRREYMHHTQTQRDGALTGRSCPAGTTTCYQSSAVQAVDNLSG